jgi:hypothetical protein
MGFQYLGVAMGHLEAKVKLIVICSMNLVKMVWSCIFFL